MNVTYVERITPPWVANRAASITAHGKKVKAPMKAWYKTEHSPIRCELWWVELDDLPTFVSTHLVRHKHGVEHFVESHREDRGGSGEEDRNSPVRHAMVINSQALIQISRKRLCYQSHIRTVAAWKKVRNAMPKELREHMVPECVYRNGMCPEFKECKPGMTNVLRAYGVSSDDK